MHEQLAPSMVFSTFDMDQLGKICWQLWKKRLKMSYNRPFYRYGGHFELIRFKEYYRMPRGLEHISLVFSSAFRDIFS